MTDGLRRQMAPRLLRSIVLVLLAGVLSPTANADDALDLYNLAVGAYRQERWALAAESFGRFTKQYPQHPKLETARLFQGLSLTNARDYKAARPVWRAFAKDYPQSDQQPVAKYRIAECSYLLNDLEAAETEFETFLANHQKHELSEWALPFLAETELALDKPKEAVAHYEQSLTTHPKGALLADVKFGLGRALEKLDRGDEAAARYREVAADVTNRLAPQAQLNLATLDFDRGRFAAAADAYEAFETRFPKSPLLPTAQLNAGFAWFQVGDYRKAIARFESAAKTPAQAVTAGYWKGMALKSLGEHAAAANSFAATYLLAQKAKPVDPLAESIRFQQADCRLRNREFASARTLFLEVEDNWPQGKFVEQALHAAGEASLLLARQLKNEPATPQTNTAVAKALDQAIALTDRFETKYPKSELRPRHDLLIGRILVQRGGVKNLSTATERFRSVLKSASDASTRLLAGFHLAQVLQKQGQHAEVVKVAVPVVAEVARTGATSEYLGALIIAGNSHLALGNNDETVRLMTRYLQLAPEGDEADLALAARIVAHARRKEKEAVHLDLATLRDQFPKSPLVTERMLQVAEVAYDSGDWNWAAEWFEAIVKQGKQSPEYSAALSGLGWSRFEQGKFVEAAAVFKQFVAEIPSDPLRSAEAAYMHGQALQKADQSAEAASVYQSAFNTYRPKTPAKKGAENQRPFRFAFLAGLLAARTYDQLGEAEKSDKAYEELLAAFPEAGERDKLLDEWALMNLRAKRFTRSDEVFTRLVEECPESSLADNAALSLAESQFIAGKLDEARQVFDRLIDDGKTDEQVRLRSRYQLMELSKEQADWATVIAQADVIAGDDSPTNRYRQTARFRRAEALLMQGKAADAQKRLLELYADRNEPAVASARWLDRVWVLLAETYVRQKAYDKVESTVTEFQQARPKSQRLFEAWEILGRAHKNRANWDQARTAFNKTLADERARGTETAAKAQLMIAETWWHQQEYAKAQAAYLKVYLLYNFPDWQAPALYQVGRCDEQLSQWAKAAKTYRELQEKFPKSEFAEQAAMRLKEIGPKLSG